MTSSLFHRMPHTSNMTNVYQYTNSSSTEASLSNTTTFIRGIDNYTCMRTFSVCDNKTQWEAFNETYQIYHGYLVILICVIGTLLNIANIAVLSRPKMAVSPINFQLMVIAIAVVCLLVVNIPMAILFYILADRSLPTLYLPSQPSASFLYFSTSFTVVCHSIAIWLTIAVASFRWITLGFPNGKMYCSLKNAYICSAVVIIGNLLLSIGNWHSNKVTTVCLTNCYNKTTVTYTIAPRSNTITFNAWIFACFGKILPSVLLTILTMLLLIIMHKAEKKRQQLINKGKRDESKRHQEHNRTTGMLLSVVVIFLLIELPHGFLILCLPYYGAVSKFYNNVGELIDLLTLLAFSVNFILYTIMSKQFRTTFVSLFCQTIPESDIFRKISTAFSAGGSTSHSSPHNERRQTTPGVIEAEDPSILSPLVIDSETPKDTITRCNIDPESDSANRRSSFTSVSEN